MTPTAQLDAPTSAETVARRIVMSSDTWNRLVQMADLLAEAKDMDISPTDVAVLALEAGLERVDSARKAPEPPAQEPKTTSGKSRRPVPRLRLSEEDRSQLRSWLAGKRSVRARQRTIALWLGRRRRRVHLDWLRELAVGHGAYNVANFAQNMKKDGHMFEELRDPDGRRMGWRLTRLGHEAARKLEERSVTTRF